MLTTLLLTLFLGIIWGILLSTIALCYLIKVKCPQCKQLRPLKAVILFQWKTRTITGQSCPRCQRPQSK